jgi:hypothetical protein
MKNISDFLKRFQSLTPPDDSVRKELARVASEVSGAAISSKDIRTRNGVAFINGSSIIKSAVAVHRAKILEQLYENLPKSRNTVRDIR